MYLPREFPLRWFKDYWRPSSIIVKEAKPAICFLNPSPISKKDLSPSIFSISYINNKRKCLKLSKDIENKAKL